MDTELYNRREEEHQKVWDLLPWFVNQTLSATEQDIVKNHIKSCSTCQMELSQQQQLFNVMQQADVAQQTSRASFARLKKRMAEQSVEETIQSDQKEPPVKSGWFGLPVFVQYAAVAGCLFLLLVPLVFDSLMQTPEWDSEYRTLANPEQQLERNVLRVVFTSQPDSESIQLLLQRISGQIIAGPSQKGVYDIQIDGIQNSPQAIHEAIAQLRASPYVVFAESVQ